MYAITAGEIRTRGWLAELVTFIHGEGKGGEWRRRERCWLGFKRTPFKNGGLVLPRPAHRHAKRNREREFDDDEEQFDDEAGGENAVLAVEDAQA